MKAAGGSGSIHMALGTKTPPQPWRWDSGGWDNDGNDGSGLRLRPAGSGGKSLAAPERDVITTPVPTVALLAAARAMTQPEPPADLGLERAVRESQLPPAPYAEDAAFDPERLLAERSSEPPPSSRRLASRPSAASSRAAAASSRAAAASSRAAPASSRAAPASSRARGGRAEGQLLESEPFEFELTPRSARNAQSSHAAPPLAEELGLDHLLADFKPRRSGARWLRAHAMWIVAGLLVLWLIVSFLSRWLAR